MKLSSTTPAQTAKYFAKVALASGIALGLLTSISAPIACRPALAQAPPRNSTPSPTPIQIQAPSTTYRRPSKDFKYRKRFIAPSSDLNSRIDYPSMQSRDSLMLPTYEPAYGKGKPAEQSRARPPVTYQPIHPNEPAEALKAQAQSLDSTSSTRRAMVNREGLTPPPPPANKKLLPASLTKQNPPNVSQAVPAAASEPPMRALSAAHIAQVKAHVEGLAKQGHIAEAQEVLTRVVQEHPHEPALRAELSKLSLERARFYAKQGSTQQAASQARLAIAYGSAYSSASESAYTLLASSLSKAGIDPKNPEARASLGSSLLAASSPLESEIEYRQAIKLRPSSDFYIGAGTASLQSGNKTSAKLDFQKALELNPDSQPALSRLGMVRYQMHDYVGANADLTRALVMNSQDTAAAQTLIDLWQRQVSSRPQDASAHLGLARAYQVTGDLDSAKHEYKTVVKIDPNHPNLPAARQSFKLALAKREAHKSFDLAHSLESQGQLAMAYQKASDAVELYPSDNNYQTYKMQLASQLQSAGIPVYAARGQALQNLRHLMQQGGQPPTTGLLTAQALSLDGGMAGNPVNTAPAPAASAAPMAADNMYQPISTDNHVTSMTGFLASLRNFTMHQQAQQNGSGSSGSSAGALSGIGGAASGGLGVAGAMASGATTSSLAGVPGFAPSNPLPGSGLSPSLGQGQLVAQGAQAQAIIQGGGAAASRGPVTAASAMQAAAQALANTAGSNAGGIGGGFASGVGGGMYAGFPGGFASSFNAGLGTAAGAPYGAPMTSTSQASVPTAASLGVSNATAASALGLGPSMAPTMASILVGGVGQALSNLGGRNPQTQATGNLAPQAAGQMNYGFTPSGNFATAQTMPTTVSQRVIETPGGNVASAQSLSITPEPANVSWPQPQPLADANEAAPPPAANAIPATNVTTAIPAASDPTSAATAAALAPPIMAAGQNNLAINTSNDNPGNMAGNYMMAGQQGGAQAGSTPLRSLIPPGALKLYLTGVKASKTDVQLQVSLRNDSPVPLKIPVGIRAVVRSNGHPDKQAKVSFNSRVVPSGSTITGSIKVPGKSLDPTADVVIPASSMTRGAIAYLHLSVPISAR